MTNRIAEFKRFESQIITLPLLLHTQQYLQLVLNKEVSLTKTKALNRVTLKKIAQFIPLASDAFEVRLEREWPYVELIDTLCDLAKLTQNRKDKKTLLKRGKDFLNDPPGIQLLVLFQTFWQGLDWAFLTYRVSEPEIATRLQENQTHCLLILYELDSWMDVGEFCSFVKHRLNLGKDENPEFKFSLSEALILRVLLKNLALFGLLEIKTENDFSRDGTMRMSELGKEVCKIIFTHLNIEF